MERPNGPVPIIRSNGCQSETGTRRNMNDRCQSEGSRCVSLRGVPLQIEADGTGGGGVKARTALSTGKRAAQFILNGHTGRSVHVLCSCTVCVLEGVGR